MLSKNFCGTVLVLDLDETLVHIKRVQKNQPTRFGETAPDFSWTPKHDPAKLYIGWKRPGFDAFFDHIFQEIENGRLFLCIWTTAAKRYALEALKRTLGDRFHQIGLLWTREEYQKCCNRKDLCELAKYLGCRLSNMVMIDDNSLVFSPYLRCGGVVWLATPFNSPAAQQDDDQLARVVSALERRMLASKRVGLFENEDAVPSLTKNVIKFRQVMINWMTHLHSKFELEDLSLHTGTHILDELFIHKPDLIDRDQIVVATTCLYIGCCYGESQAVNLSDWIAAAGGHVAYDDIVTCLQTVNRTLNYPLVEVGDVPVIILNDYLSQFRGLSFETRLRLSERARYVLELCLLNFDYKQFDVKRLVWTILFWVTTRDDSALWTGFALSTKYKAEDSALLQFVEKSAMENDMPTIGRDSVNERHQRKFVSSYGVFSSMSDVIRVEV